MLGFVFWGVTKSRVAYVPMYRMYVDETGNADLAASSNPDHRFLSLTGVIVSIPHFREYGIPEIQRIKAVILELDPDEWIPLHRNEIMQKKFPFHALRKPGREQQFSAAVLKLLRDLQYTVVTAVIDKQAHLKRYTLWQEDPYHYCLKILFERYCLILNRKGARGDVIAESRGKKENARVSAEYEKLCRAPHPIRPDVVKKCLATRKIKIKRKDQNIIGLQLADLIAHPSSMHARSVFNGEPQRAEFGRQIVQILRDSKYHRDDAGKIEGYGLKWLP